MFRLKYCGPFPVKLHFYTFCRRWGFQILQKSLYNANQKIMNPDSVREWRKQIGPSCDKLEQIQSDSKFPFVFLPYLCVNMVAPAQKCMKTPKLEFLIIHIYTLGQFKIALLLISKMRGCISHSLLLKEPPTQL